MCGIENWQLFASLSWPAMVEIEDLTNMKHGFLTRTNMNESISERPTIDLLSYGWDSFDEREDKAKEFQIVFFLA
jgi:hypothetical protein